MIATTESTEFYPTPTILYAVGQDSLAKTILYRARDGFLVGVRLPGESAYLDSTATIEEAILMRWPNASQEAIAIIQGWVRDSIPKGTLANVERAVKVALMGLG